MIKSFISFINGIMKLPCETKFILGVSGGMDSMAMLYLFQQSKFDFAVANVNFNLRDKESDTDSEFVIQYCKSHNIELHTKSFNTKEYAEKHKISTQMAARDLRYDWFNELLALHSYNKVAIAHHLDDQTETFFINLIRGTGIAGMHGIATNKDNIIRPLMFANREQIESFINKENIPYREDSSNASDKYLRNQIRHHILTEFTKLRYDFSFSLNQSINNLSEVENYADYHLINEQKSIIKYDNDSILKMKISLIHKSISPKLILYHCLKEYGFTHSHITDILDIMSNKNSGKRIQSSSHELLIDREYAYLNKKDSAEKHDNIIIENINDAKWKDANIIITPNYRGEYKTNNINYAFIDFDKIKFPLIIRLWQYGDYIYPLGMQGKKKLSDFFIDNKLSVNQKHRVKILCSGEDIVWIIGNRIDKRFSITKQTKQIIKLEYYGNN